MMTFDRATSLRFARLYSIRSRISSTSAIRLLTAFIAALFCVSLSACRSAFIETTLRNDGGQAIRLIEVDYPSASFGTQSLNSHAVYHYRFKVQGSGTVTLSFASADGKTHSVPGPTLSEGQHGTLVIAIDSADKVTWTQNLSIAK